MRLDSFYSVLEIFINILKSFTNDFSTPEIIAYIVGIFIALIGLYNYAKKELKEEEKKILEIHFSSKETVDGYLKDIRKKLPLKNPSLYKIYLKQILDVLDKFFGKLKIVNYRSFKHIFLLSYIYSSLFFILGWFLGGSSTIGNTQILFDHINPIHRISMLLSFILTAISIYFIIKYKHLEKIHQKTFGKIFILLIKITGGQQQERLDHTVMFIGMTFYMVYFWMLVGLFGIPLGRDGGGDFFIIIIILLSIYAFILYIPIIILILLRSIIYFWSEKSLLILEIFLMLLLIIILLSLLYLFGYQGTIIAFIFLIILPFINTFFDYISVYFSRLFAKKIYETDSSIKIFVDIIFDLLIALMLLYGLAWSFLYILDFVNMYLIKNQELMIPLEVYKNSLVNNPFSQDVLWITLMFLSTLIPTFLHFCLFLYAVIGNKYLPKKNPNL